MVAAALFHERVVRWLTLPGTAVRASVPDHECFVVGKPTSPSLWVLDPECFIAGDIHRHLDVWDRLTQALPNRDEIMGWIRKKVSVYDFVILGDQGAASWVMRKSRRSSLQERKRSPWEPTSSETN